ncbi:PEP-CTERM domain-containing protein [Haloferula helveola]|uniref:PEP-CTERM domain-containing protein n=1 Tax=Haloferula helveola TaxID=490095 RepID=A0ABN6H322_9BACT|nr:PEP-CTERM domain-containing protein [Haloferula helveola]
MNRQEIEQRILSLLDGELSREEAAELEAVLRSDREALRTYVKLVDLHNTLETRFSIADSAGRAGQLRADRVMARQRRRNAKRSLLAAAAVLLGLVATMAIILAPSSPPQVAVFDTYPDSRYRLTYEGEGEPPEARKLAVGSRLVLSEGAFEGVFSSGVRLVAEAPCELKVMAANRVAVEQGSAWFRVPAQAKGFTAETPELVVVDLGTEFGVVSAAGAPDEVHVMAGSVEVAARSGEGAKEILKAGMARRVEADGQLTEIPHRSASFRKRIDRFAGAISRFSFANLPPETSRVRSFASFAEQSPSEDVDPFSMTSLLSNSGYTAGGYGSFYIRDIDGGTVGVDDPGDYLIFSKSGTPGSGMNVGNAGQSEPTHYIAFSVTPGSGHELTFSSLTFYTGVHAPNDRYHIELRTWDGESEARLGSVSHTSGASSNEPVAFKTIDFEDFTSRDPIEFRLYGYGVDSPQGSRESAGIRYDDITLTGSNVALSGADEGGR